MINKLPDLTKDINSDAPFEKCALGREPYAELLTQIVKNTEKGVISLNGGWGTGKTTFVRMWEAYLNQRGFTTIYFNVWDNDYSVDPIISLMSQLFKVFKKDKQKKSFASILSSFGKITLNVAKPIAKGAIKKLSGVNLDEVVDGLQGASEVAIDEVASLGEKLLDRVSEEHKNLEDFKKALESIVSSTSSESDSSDYISPKPIVCFMDELDRCNPQYAVLVLERIKHVFSVPGIVFVLSVDKKQFGNAVRGYYGSNLIDADEYLRRFIDLDLNLPKITSDKFWDYLYQSFDFNSVFSKRTGDDIRRENNNFQEVGKLLMSYSSLTLRQAEKIMSHLHLVLSTLSYSHHFTATIFLILLYIRATNSDFYDNILRKEYTLQEFITELERVFKNLLEKREHDSISVRILTFSLAEIVCMYNTDRYGMQHEKIVDDSDKERKLLVHLNIIPEEDFLDALNWPDMRFRGRIPSIDTITSKIELVNSFL